jgi:uncharacterized membrane protein YgcG
MDRNPYDASIDWLQQSPVNKRESVYTTYQQESVQTQTPPIAKKAAPAKQPRMSKQKALELVSSLKKGIVVSSVMSFGLITLLATGHVVGTTTNTTNTGTSVTSNSSTTTTTPSSSSNSSSSNTSSSSTSQGGFSFGTSSSQGSVSGTSVS